MNTNRTELNLNELKAINGGFDLKKFLNQFGTEDAALCIFLGPIGQGIVAAKAIVAVAETD